MARQPFLPTYKDDSYSVGYRALEERPEFARLIGECIAVWSYIDNEMGTMLGLLLGSHSEAMIDVFLSLRRSSNQREALNTAALHSLKHNDEARLAFDAIMTMYRSFESQRNDLAHGLFGVMAKHPDILLWIETKHHIHFITDTLAKEKRGIIPSDRHEILKQHLFVYTLNDIQSLHADITEFWFAPFDFNSWLRHKGTAIGEGQFQRLCAMPHIQREMSRLRLDRENNPKAPPSPPRPKRGR